MLSLAQRLRMGHIGRWHMVRTHREQTLAEHVALVQLIALDVAARFAPGDRRLERQVMEWALWHDMPEVVMGDISPPFKTMLSHRYPTLLAEIEDGLDATYVRIRRETSEIADLIVKFADLLEARNFIRVEGAGRRAREITLDIEQSIDELVGGIELIPGLVDAMKSTRKEIQ